ncbi:hypothetical protein AX14_007150 [Amanita brunnescens Koide BX004]|nr:hypothetical protein AX14_007150 [Amanita brunnescens Koide BX004]
MLQEAAWSSLVATHRLDQLKRTAFLTLQVLGSSPEEAAAQVKSILEKEKQAFNEYQEAIKYAMDTFSKSDEDEDKEGPDSLAGKE